MLGCSIRKVIIGGMWMIFDYYLRHFNMEPEFQFIYGKDWEDVCVGWDF
jgi:hypothetical protein